MLFVICSFGSMVELRNLLLSEVQGNLVPTWKIPYSYCRVLQQNLPKADPCELKVRGNLRPRLCENSNY